jgi:hypothetical protein
MMRILAIFLLIITTALLCGCPYDSPYNLDEMPLQNIDESLIGTWSVYVSCHGNEKHRIKEERIKICFAKRTENDYDIVVTGHIEDLKPYHVIADDSIKCTAYLSTVARRQFLNAYIHGKVYVAEVIKDSNTISLLPLAEYFTSKLIKNSRELRIAVAFHYKVKSAPAYDPFFSLRNLNREPGPAMPVEPPPH